MEYMTTQDAAKMMGVTPQTIRNLVAANDFAPAYAVTARKFLYRREDVIAWFETRRLNNIDHGAN